jgi:hypothetical protein
MSTINLPIAASGSRSPTKRPRGIPQKVRTACERLVWDEDEKFDLIAAAQVVGLRPDTLRRWLHRPEVISFVLRERAALRQAICARSEQRLSRIADASTNEMAKVSSIKTLEDLNATASALRGADATSPGITIQIINTAPAEKPPRVIDAIDTVVPASDEDQTADR